MEQWNNRYEDILFCLIINCKITFLFLIRRVIYETNGNIYVIKFVGILLQLISAVQMRKNKVIHNSSSLGKNLLKYNKKSRVNKICNNGRFDSGLCEL